MKWFRVDECYDCGHKRLRFDSWRAKWWFKHTLFRRPKPPVDPALERLASSYARLAGMNYSAIQDIVRNRVDTFHTGGTVKWSEVQVPNVDGKE